MASAIVSAEKPLCWGILGTGGSVELFARAVTESSEGRLIAVASQSAERAAEMGVRFKAARCYGSYKELINDESIEAVFVAVDSSDQDEWAVRAARAGKHLLFPGPVALDYPAAQRVAESAYQCGVLVMEARELCDHPGMARLVEVVQSGDLGKICRMDASCTLDGNGTNSWLRDSRKSGGAILHAGRYPVSLARLINQSMGGLPGANPTDVLAFGNRGNAAGFGYDSDSTALLHFGDGMSASCSAAIADSNEFQARIVGSRATLRLPATWLTDGAFVLERQGQDQEFSGDTEGALDFRGAISLFTKRVREGEGKSTDQCEHILENMRTLDLWRNSIGSPPLRMGRSKNYPLQPVPQVVTAMSYGFISGLTGDDGSDRTVSRLVMNGDFEGHSGDYRLGEALFDDFYERGGNCFISGTTINSVLGFWSESRRVRDKITVVGHSSGLSEFMPQAIWESLGPDKNKSFFARRKIELGFDGYYDVYMLYRDNPDVPVGEFIDVLNRLKNAGVIRAFGAADWELDRLAEANEYAARNGLSGFSLCGNKLSLGRLRAPIMEGYRFGFGARRSEEVRATSGTAPVLD